MIFNCDAKTFQKRNQQAGGSRDCGVLRTMGLTLRCHPGLLAQISTWPVSPQGGSPSRDGGVGSCCCKPPAPPLRPVALPMVSEGLRPKETVGEEGARGRGQG